MQRITTTTAQAEERGYADATKALKRTGLDAHHTLQNVKFMSRGHFLAARRPSAAVGLFTCSFSKVEPEAVEKLRPEGCPPTPLVLLISAESTCCDSRLIMHDAGVTIEPQGCVNHPQVAFDSLATQRAAKRHAVAICHPRSSAECC